MKRHNHQTAFSHSIIRLFDYSIIGLRRLFDYSIISQRRGSALLIVLGMLSFMVISAVAFSVMMRQNRLPSSYLRRNIAARHLVRAALARAIEELEGDFNENRDWGKYEASESDLIPRFYGIYDDPYPGVGWKQSTTDPRQDGDFWFRRVFMPFGPTKYAECTVPTMTLESLAYLPPALVDDVRKFSRFTRTASWRTLPYESGRYAYVAVNVSDLFDINRLRAGEARDSGANRITLQTLFARVADDPFDIDTSAAQQFDRFIDPDQNGKLNVGGNYVPFVSLADFNLVVGKGSSYAPFMDYIGKSSTTFLKSGDPKMANAMFITDTYFPTPTGTSAGSVDSTSYDLAVNGQPFKQWTANKYQDTVSGCMTDDSKLREIYRRNLDASTACLYDYLDSDSIPFSLAFPTTEAVPMIVGIGSPAAFKPQITVGASGDDKFEVQEERTINGHKYKVKRTGQRTCLTGFSGNNALTIRALAAYPFKRMKTTKRNSTFKARGLMKAFFCPAAPGFGCRAPSEDLRPQGNDDYRAGTAVYANGVATFASETEPALNFTDDNLKVEDKKFLEEFTLSFRPEVIVPAFWDIEETYEPVENDPQNPTPPLPTKKARTMDGLGVQAANVLCAIDGNGTVNNAGNNWVTANDANLQRNVRDLNINVEDLSQYGHAGDYSLQIAFWIQVVDKNGTVVDMVPATSVENEIWLGKQVLTQTEPTMGGEGAPLLNFVTQYAVKFDETFATAFGAEATFSWKALYAVDPRFNHAPEDWFARTDDHTGLKDKWCDALGAVGNSSQVFGQDGRDRDVFMFVSDQEYLQDIGELQFLPALADEFRGTAANPAAAPAYSPVFNGKTQGFDQRLVSATVTSADLNKMANGGYFWRTYSSYRTRQGGATDPIYALPDGSGKAYRIVSNANGFKLNPYSDDGRVLAAALAGTPFDYYVASTNDNQQTVRNTLIQSITPQNMKSTYSFGESSAAKIDPDDMFAFFDVIREAFGESAQQGGSDWTAVWNDLEWQCVEHPDEINDNNKHLLDDSVALSGNALHGVDRKFLSSFWHECFDNRQQLFLIFVRAEPQSAAGGTIGRNMPSSQLGGRAVALVWRDPAVPTYVKSGQRKPRSQLSNAEVTMDNRENSAPHRTRILFYHQFE